MQGVVDGDAVTLTVRGFLGTTDATLTGRRTGDRLILTAPTASGAVATITFLRGSQNDYNALVGDWQKTLLMEYQAFVAAKASADAYAAAGAAVKAHATDLAAAIADLDTFTKRITDRIAAVKGAAAGQKSVLGDMQKHYAKLQKDAAVRPMTYQACLAVWHDYKVELDLDLNTYLKLKQDAFKTAVENLQASLDAVPGRVQNVRSVAEAYRRALRTPHPSQQVSVLPGDEAVPLSAYQAATDQAARDLAEQKAIDASVRTSAASTMANAKVLYDSVQAITTC